MPLPIQRVPRGLSDILSIFGGQSPNALADTVQPTIELLQFYGLNQKITISATAVIAQGNRVTNASAGGLALNNWSILYAATARAAYTATMTGLSLGVEVQRGSGAVRTVWAAGQAVNFVAPGEFNVSFVPPYPLLLPPQSQVSCLLAQLGTDANAACAITLDVGLLG